MRTATSMVKGRARSALTVGLISLGAAACGVKPTNSAVGSQTVIAGMVRRDLQDSARRSWSGARLRPITTLIWYPVVGVAPAESLSLGPPGDPWFFAGVVATAAPMVSPGVRRPLVVLSHGTGGSAMQMAWLGTALAREGYIVAAVNHHGNSGADMPPDARGFFLWWERASDLTVVIDRMLADPTFGPSIDPSRIAAAGFSLGGYTVTALAGGLTDRALFASFCQSPEADFTCGPQPEFLRAPELFAAMVSSDSATLAALSRAGSPHRDARVKAVVALSPAVVRALTPPSLAAIRIPVLVIAAGADHVAPPPTNGQYLAANVKSAQLILLPGADHYIFLDPCTPRGKVMLAENCVDKNGLDRPAVQRRVVGDVLTFLRRALPR